MISSPTPDLVNGQLHMSKVPRVSGCALKLGYTASLSTPIIWFPTGGALTALTLTTFKEKINYSEILYQKKKKKFYSCIASFIYRKAWVLNFKLTIKQLNIYISCLLNFSKIPQKIKWLILSLVFILKTANSVTEKRRWKSWFWCIRGVWGES